MNELTPTIGSLLEFDFEEPPHAEIEKLQKYGGLLVGAFGTSNGLANRYWLSAAASVFRALGKALDRPVTELFAGGWNHYQPFLKYRDAKRYPPDVVGQEELFTHTIDAKLTPSIKVLLNGDPVTEIKFQLDVKLKLEAGTVTIQSGKFKSLRPGKCRATASLRCAGALLLERKSPELKLPGELRFGDGIPIVPTGTHADATC